MQNEINKALEVLKNGGTILYPTDTIWGIGCDATNESAIARIFDIKKQLDGDTEDFEYAEMKIYKRNKVYEITDGKAYGGLMALTLNGTIDNFVTKSTIIAIKNKI